MGWKKGEDEPIVPSSLSDALLFTTLCIVGLPVEVQVKDGSIYSGIFHTACLDKGYDIVLKKARNLRRGKGDMSLSMGGLIDTLVVLSNDLVQVVVKDFQLPSEGIVANVAAIDFQTAPGAVVLQALNGDLEREPKSSISSDITSLRNFNKNEEKKVLASLENPQVEDDREHSIQLEKSEEPSIVPSLPIKERQIGEDRMQREKSTYSHTDMVSVEYNVVPEIQFLRCIPYVSLPGVNPEDETNVDISSKKVSDEAGCRSPAAISVRPESPECKFPTPANPILSDADTSTVSTSVSILVNNCPLYPRQSISANPSSQREDSTCNTSAKEFKLNPGAEVFVPSCRPAPASLPTASSTDFVSNIHPVTPAAVAPSSFEISRLSLPTKLVQYNNLVAGYKGVSAQYCLPIVGHAGSRQQPVRFSGQFHPLQAGPTYMHPCSQTVMVGRLGQLMYIHPVPQDAIQGTPFLSQGPPRPLLAPYQAHVPKLEGSAEQSLQFIMAPSEFGLHPSQPFPAVGPSSISGGNAIFGSKLQ